MEKENLKAAVHLIKKAGKIVAFTGAGISVESGIPPFRGEKGLWNTYNPDYFHIDYFKSNPEDSWRLVKKLFYEFYGKVKPNAAHSALAAMENRGLLHAVITQNIDNLHQEAGSRIVIDFHGNLRHVVCTKCRKRTRFADVDPAQPVPECPACGGIVKPDIVFFGEPISPGVQRESFRQAEEADVLLVIGTTGEVMPASMIVSFAKENGADIIEINTTPSMFTHSLTDIFLQGKAAGQMTNLCDTLGVSL
ncbi:MAG: NAD-dependent deacylase [Spirochaetales bacterium]|nr:NAD-dependent deacylase [Spirochaetales bacterium]